MAHPFFDVHSFPWRRPEAEPFRRALVALYSHKPDIDRLFQICGGAAGDLNLDDSPSRVWKDALDRLPMVAGGLSLLCTTILAENPRLNESACAAIRAVQDAQPAIAARRLSDRQFVLDREPLRNQLMALAEGPSNVLILRGPTGSGKSYSRLLIKRAADEAGAIMVSFEDNQMPNVDEILVELFTKAGPTKPPPMRTTTDAAWYRFVCARLKELVERKRQPLWIVVDDLGSDPDGPQSLTGIREFWNEVAWRFANFEYQQWFRLVLIDYPANERPANWTEEYFSELSLDEAEIQAQHVEEGLREWQAAHRLNMIPSEITQRAQAIIARAEAPSPPSPTATLAHRPPCRLQRIHKELTAELLPLTGRQ